MTEADTPKDNTRYTIGLLALMTMLLYADQNLLAPNLTQVAVDLGLDPAERDIRLGGNISLAFFLVGGVLSLLVGRLADRLHRRNLLVLLTFIGELPCAAVAFVTEYHELFILRMLTGIAIGGAAPLTYSLLADLVPPRKRPAMAGVILMALGFGIVFGQMLAGFMGPTYGWRIPFVIVTIPNLMVAILFLLTTREPERGRFDDGAEIQTVSPEQTFTEVFSSLLQIPTNRILVLQGMLGTLPWAMIFVFLNDYLAQDCGLGVKPATLLIGVLGVCSLIGAGLGGIVGSKIYTHSPQHLPMGCIIPTALAPVPLIFLLNPDWGAEGNLLWVKVLLAALTGFLGAFAVPNLRAILLEVNQASTRGSMTAVMTLADDVGKGFGAALISFMALWLGRETSFYICALSWIGCAGAMFFLLRSFVSDLKPNSRPMTV